MNDWKLTSFNADVSAVARATAYAAELTAENLLARTDSEQMGHTALEVIWDKHGIAFAGGVGGVGQGRNSLDASRLQARRASRRPLPRRNLPRPHLYRRGADDPSGLRPLHRMPPPRGPRVCGQNEADARPLECDCFRAGLSFLGHGVRTVGDALMTFASPQRRSLCRPPRWRR